MGQPDDRSRYRDDMKESAKIFGLTLPWFFGIALTIGVISFGYLLVMPWYLERQRDVYTASHQYIESARQELSQATVSYRLMKDQGAPRAQLNAMVQRMCVTGMQIPRDEIPPATLEIIGVCLQ